MKTKKAEASKGTFQNSTQQKCNKTDRKLSVIAWAQSEREIWTSYKTLLNTKHEEVGLIRSKEGRLLYAPEEISKEFKTTFFGGEHPKKQSFNDATQLQVEDKTSQPHCDPEIDNEVFHDEITFDELKNLSLKKTLSFLELKKTLNLLIMMVSM